MSPTNAQQPPTQQAPQVDTGISLAALTQRLSDIESEHGISLAESSQEVSNIKAHIKHSLNHISKQLQDKQATNAGSRLAGDGPEGDGDDGDDSKDALIPPEELNKLTLGQIQAFIHSEQFSKLSEEDKKPYLAIVQNRLEQQKRQQKQKDKPKDFLRYQLNLIKKLNAQGDEESIRQAQNLEGKLIQTAQTFAAMEGLNVQGLEKTQLILSQKDNLQAAGNLITQFPNLGICEIAVQVQAMMKAGQIEHPQEALKADTKANIMLKETLQQISQAK